MKWYQPFECDNTVKIPLICDFDNLLEFGYSENTFVFGNEVNNWPEIVSFTVKNKKNDGDPDDVLQNHLLIPIFSQRLINKLIENYILGIQYLPVNVYKYDGSILNGFCIANYLNFVDALCFEKSEYTLFRDDFPNPNVRGKIAAISNYVLIGNKLEGLDIIRLKEYKRRFFVSQRFKDVFDKNGLTGYSFKEIELV